MLYQKYLNRNYIFRATNVDDEVCKQFTLMETPVYIYQRPSEIFPNNEKYKGE